MKIKATRFLLLNLCSAPVHALPRKKPDIDNVRMKYFIDIAKKEVMRRNGGGCAVDWM